MKIRNGYVSNSSSSSFIVDFDTSDKGIACIKLSDEIIKCLQENLTDDENKLLNLSGSKTWYLTEFVNDCDNKGYGLVSEKGIHYMDGGFREPYGDEDQYIVLKNSMDDEFYLNKGDIFGSIDGIPSGIDLSLKIQKILKSKVANKIKLGCIQEIVNKVR